MLGAATASVSEYFALMLVMILWYVGASAVDETAVFADMKMHSIKMHSISNLDL